MTEKSVDILAHNSLSSTSSKLFWALGLLSLGSVLVGMYSHQFILIGLPFVIFLAFFVSIHFSFFYWILLACIPFSIVIDFSKSLSTDFPTEFLSIALTGFFWFHTIVRDRKPLIALSKHPISLLLIALLFWAMITTITAQNHIIALKYCLAKIWYLTSYFVMTYYFISSWDKVRKFFWLFFIPLMITALISFAKTKIGGFDFERTSEFSLPFYENHVLYATTMTIFLPFVFLARRWYGEGTLIRILLNLSILFLLISIYFSYTRACYLALVLALGIILLIKVRKILMSLSLLVLIIGGLLGYLSHQYYYLNLAPDYTKTVMHPEFKDHIVATFQGKDASSMERINMWVSVFRMSVDYPWTGVGPNNFPFCYKPYSVLYFKTWVSDNPLNLSCHNYFWLLLAEQGWLGMILFLGLIFSVFYFLQYQYHFQKDKETKYLVLILTASISIVLVNLIFSDLIENAKNGSLFYILLALVVRIETIAKSGKSLKK